jgi:hypothetical protein
MNYLNDGIVFGVSSLGCPLIAINLDENPISGETPDYIKELLLEVLGIDIIQRESVLLDINQIDEILQKHIELLINDEGKNKYLSIYVSYLTSFIHEIRHYHDQISTSTGLDYLYYSLSQYVNTPAIFTSILDLFHNKKIEHITIPFDYKDISEENMSTIRFQELVNYFERASKVDKKTSSNWNLDYPKLTSATLETLFETSAVTSQLGFAFEVMDQKGFDLILNLIKSTERGNRYIDGIRILQEFKVGNSNSFGVQSAHINFLSWYALNGLKPLNSDFKDSPSPIILWEFLLYNYSISELGDLTTSELMTFCDNITSEWKLLDCKSSFLAWDDIMNNRINHIESEIKKIDVDYLPTHKFSVVDFRKIMADRKTLFEIQNKDLNLYFDTQAYGWGVLSGLYPRPTIALQYNNDVSFLNSNDREFGITSELFFWEIIHNLLIYGRGNAGPLFLENYVFEMLIKNNDIKFWLN